MDLQYCKKCGALNAYKATETERSEQPSLDLGAGDSIQPTAIADMDSISCQQLCKTEDQISASMNLCQKLSYKSDNPKTETVETLSPTFTSEEQQSLTVTY